MKNIYIFVFILLIFSMLFSCSGSKRVFKKAAELEKGGLHEEAAEMYLEALNRNNENNGKKIPAQIAQPDIEGFGDFFSCRSRKFFDRP